ncbi:hypothetical protein [Rhizobium lusitanum]|uniref:hypothetical protein n=1 Tax=Rhizobium lusitanum TaxID=293958 RepID=UPI001AEF55FF|nr:hypothetical protein [Rhizobium lusitanum]
MNGPVTWEVLSWLIVAITFAIGLCFGAFWKIWSLIDQVRKEANEKIADLDEEISESKEAVSEYKTHIAETYVTKAGMQEQTSQLLRALEGIGKRIDGLNDRLDRIYDGPATTRRSRSNQA